MKSEYGEIVIYKADDGLTKLDVQLRDETIWLSLNQIATLFDRDKSVISRHINNIFKSGELTRDTVVAKYATTAADGKTYQVDYYNLDGIISVGYRVNSIRGTQFRIWATTVLKDHPFIDGNKRIGAFLFLLFLRENNILEQSYINQNALVALTLLIAENKSSQKELMIKLILNFLNN